MYEDRSYLIVPISEISKINFNEIEQTSEKSLRKTNDKQKFIIKWDNESPSFINLLNNTEGPYNYEEVLEILKQPEWNDILE